MSEKVKLYRVENPNIPVDPRVQGTGGTSHPVIRGMWFSDSLGKALNYLPKATQYKPEGKGDRPFVLVDGAVNHIAEIEKSELGLYRAADHPIVQEIGMDIEPLEDYILPLEAIVDTVPIDEIAVILEGR